MEDPGSDVWENISKSIEPVSEIQKEKSGKSNFIFFISLIIFSSPIIIYRFIPIKLLPAEYVQVLSQNKSVVARPMRTYSIKNKEALTVLESGQQKVSSSSIVMHTNCKNKRVPSVPFGYKMRNTSVFISQKFELSGSLPEDCTPINLQIREVSLSSGHTEQFPEPSFSIKMVTLPSIRDTDSIKCPAEKPSIVFGLAGEYSNSWILNNVTYTMFNQNKPDISTPYFKPSFMVFVSFTHKKINLQAEININSRIGQSYQTYSDGYAYKKELQLSYFQFNLFNKLNIRTRQNSFGIKTKINFLAGLTYGRLLSATQTINYNKESVTNQYCKNDLAVLLGFEYRLQYKRFEFSTSLRTNIGVVDIFSGNINLPAELNRTYSSSVYLTGGIGYVFQ